MKNSNKEKNLKSSQRKKSHITFTGINTGMSVDFL